MFGLIAALMVAALGVVFLAGGDENEPTSGSAATTVTTSGSAPTTSVSTTTPTTPPASSDDGGLGGSSVVVYGNLLTDDETGALTDVLAAFTERTGIEVEFVPIANLGAEIGALAAAGDAPDLALLPQPGVVAELARSGALAGIPDDLTAAVSAHWPPAWMAFGEVDGGHFAIPAQSDLKSLVWFKPGRFEALGYAVPQTWDELRALTDQAVADGNTPWCVGLESGEATGWVFTDWVEDLTLRFFGAEYYDRWVAHDVPFNSREMAAVWREILEMWAAPGAVYGGPDAITSTQVFEPAGLLVDDLCLMHRQASFLGPRFPPGSEGVGVFYFPGAPDDRPVLVSGTFAAAFRDAPEVWALMEYLGSAEYATERQEVQARLSAGVASGFLTANTAVDPGIFSPLERSMLDIQLSGEPVRFDGSDQMPAAVGTGSFWVQATRVVNGEIGVEEALEIIESTWP